jgi:peptide/nickel transport system substrate-binding protein
MRKKFLVLLTILLLVVGSAPTMFAQDAPEGTWFGTWPYVLPPEHHLNAYADGGPNSNLGNLYRGLVELAPAFYFAADNSYEPVLAESWGFVDDNTAYEITLKADAMWSDGAAITSEDVITTYELGRLVGWSQFSSIDVIEALDEQTIRFNFIDGEPSLNTERLILKEYIVSDAVYGDFADRAIELFATGADSESEEWQALLTELREFRPDTLVASGPYTYTLDDVGDSFMTLSWQPNSLYSDSVNFGELKIWAGETDSTTPLVLSGDIAHSTNVYPPSVVQSFADEGIEIVTIPRGYGPALLFNHQNDLWSIKEVRQATALVIDRDQNAFLTNGLGAAGTVYMSGILDTASPALLPADVLDQLDRYEFDTERAAGLMESAGFSLNADGIWADADGNTASATWIYPQEFADFSGATQDAAEQLNTFGFDIELQGLPWQEVPTRIREGDFDMTVWSWGLGSPFAERHFWNPLKRWQTDLDPDQPGLGIDFMVEVDGETVDLIEMINSSSAGLDLEAQRVAAGEVSLILNDLMLYVPLNEIISAEPFNTNLISGLPEVGDPILQNATGSDHFVIWGILQGDLGPAS